MTNFIRQTFLSFVTALLICGQVTYGLAQSATPIPQPLTQFFDANGNPLASGTVKTYIPNTSTLKNTWQDINDSVVNSNPLTLDAAGRAKIFGNGSYRFEVRDSLNNLIYDYVTNASNPGGAVIVTGDGDQVGTIKPWAGLLAPNQYAFAFGQAISRTTYSVLLTAITQSITANCTSGSSTLTGISDTSQIPNGAAVEASCLAPGTTVLSKTASTVVVSANASSTTSLTAVFFPYGNGDGSTTFNVPDLRGYVIAGRSNMGGVAASNLTSTFFGSNPQAVGAKGGTQSETLLSSNLPSISPILNLIDPGHTHPYLRAQSNATYSTPGGGGAFDTNATVNTTSNTTGITITSNHIGGSGAALSAVLITAGSGYTNGAQVLTISGGTCTVQPAFNVTVAGNVVTSVNSVSVAGNCSVPPAMPASVTGGGGTGAKLDVLFTAQPVTTIQPTFTLNYIIKLTPDASATVASGVASLGGQTGAIGCSTGIICTGNNILVDNTVVLTTTSNPILIGNWIFNPTSGVGITLNSPANSTTSALIVNNPSPSGVLSSFQLNQFNCGLTIPDNIDAGATPANSCLAVSGHTGGQKGGRNLFNSTLVITSAPALGDGLPQWVAGTFFTLGNVTAGGTGIATLAQTNGVIYGVNPVGQLANNAQFYSEVTGGEVNYSINTGASVWYGNNLSLVSMATHKVHAAYYEAALAISAITGSVGTNNGILFGPMNGIHPVPNTGILIAATNLDRSGVGTVAATVDSFIDFHLYSCTNKEINFPSYTVDCSGNTLGGTYNKITLTQPATAATLTITNNKIFAVSNSLTLTGTDATSFAFPSVSDTVAGLGTAQTFTAINTFSNATASTTTTTGAVKISVGGLGVVGAINGGTTVSAWDSTVQVSLRGNSGSSVGMIGTTSNHALQVMVNNSAVASFVAGLQMASPTGGDKGSGTINLASDYFQNGVLTISHTAPTISSGFCTSPTIPNSNGTAAFTINVGSACAASTGTLSMPTATTGWVCSFYDVTTPNTNVINQTGGATNTVTLTNYVRTTGVAGNFTSSDVIRVMCHAY